MTPAPRKQTHPLIIFLVIAFAMGWTFQLALPDVGLQFAMWAPAIAVLSLGRRGFDVFVSMSRVRPRWCLIGAAIGLTPPLLQQLILFILGWGGLNVSLIEWGPFGIAHLRHARFLLGNGEQSLAYFTLNASITVIVGGIMATLLGAIGEEIGWRGFLLPRLSAKLGWLAAAVVTGLVASLWHLPSEGWLAAPLLFFGLPLSWLRVKSEGVWPCAVAVGFFATASSFKFIAASSDLASAGTLALATALVALPFARSLRTKPTGS